MKFPETKNMTAKDILFYVCIVLLGLLALSIVMRLLPPAIFLFLILAPPIFVLSDAQERRVKRPVLWGTFTLFTNVFGLVVYLLVRPDQTVSQRCSSCNGVLEEKFSHCPWCGEKAPRPLNKCPECTEQVKQGWKFCPHCNCNLESVAPATDAAPKTEPIKTEA